MNIMRRLVTGIIGIVIVTISLIGINTPLYAAGRELPRGHYCNPDKNFCMDVSLKPDDLDGPKVVLSWSGDNDLIQQVWIDPPPAQSENNQIEYRHHSSAEILLERDRLYTITSQTCSRTVVIYYVNTNCYGWTDPATKIWTGQHEVYGAILDRYQQLGLQYGKNEWGYPLLGLPTSDEAWGGLQTGRYNFFEHGVIFWTPEWGAHEVYGPILQEWNNQYRENGPLGYPTTDTQDLKVGDEIIGKVSHFECGQIRYVYYSSKPITVTLQHNCQTKTRYYNP